MGETFGYPERRTFIAAKFLAKPLAIGRGGRPQIHGDVENPAIHHRDELGLGGGINLEMQTAENAATGSGVIVLDKTHRLSDRLIKNPSIPVLYEKSLVISVNGRLENQNVRQTGLSSFHVFGFGGCDPSLSLGDTIDTVHIPDFVSLSGQVVL